MARSSTAAPLTVDAVESLRVLIVDDSAVARAVLARMVTEARSLSVVGQCDTADRAIQWFREHAADIVLLDINMPGRSGIAALPDILAAGGGARVIVISSASESGAAVTIEALALGAADTLPKPSATNFDRRFREDLIGRITRVGAAARSPIKASTLQLRAASDLPVELVAVGASTGGIEALSAFFQALPASFAAPILVTQHLPPSFMPHLAKQIARWSDRIATVAVDGARICASHVLIAPGHAHLGVAGRAGYARVALSEIAVPTRCCPSVDPMIASLAPFGTGAVAVVLSGMGNDGLTGGRVLALAGGTVLAQDAASSAVWGMPGAIARARLATLVAPPDKLAKYLVARGSR